MRSSATRGSPARPSRNSEWVAQDSGVLVLAISSASTSRAGTKWQSSRFGPSQPRFSKSSASTRLGGVWPACSAIGSLRSSAPRHVDQEGRRRRSANVPRRLNAEMHEPLERGAGGEILALDAVDVGEADRLVARHLVDVAVGVAGAQHRLAVRAQLGVGMRRRAGVVRPVVHGGDAGIGELDQAEHHAGVEILGGEQLGGRVLGREIAEAVADEVAAERAPHVVVRVDEARHDDHVGGVDGLGAGRREIGADRLDPAVADVHVGARQHAERRIDRDDRAVLDQDSCRAASSGAAPARTSA